MTKPCFAFVFFILLSCLMSYSSIHAQPSLNRSGKDFALFFANKDYDNSYWDGLKNPIRDAEAIAEELEEMYGFQTEIHRDYSKKEIEDVLRRWRSKKFPDDAQLFIFFSGHGAFDGFYEEGYFIPRDGGIKNRSSHLSLFILAKIITKIDCPHILVAVDACYSGTMNQKIALKGKGPIMKRPGIESNWNLQSIIDKQLRNRSRLLITSGEKSRTFDGDKHSPFAAGILSGLRQAYLHDDVLTYFGLLSVLERVSPTPHHGKLPLHEDGSFVFVTKDAQKEKKTSPFVTDTDGNRYPILYLAGKQWLGKNLSLEVQDSYCYDDDPANCREYGRLYTRDAAKEACRQLGPGWRLPTNEDYEILGEYFGDGSVAYKALMEDGKSGFAARLGGYRGRSGEFIYLGRDGYYWSSTENGAGSAWGFGFNGGGERANRARFLFKSSALSCRCLKD